MDDSKKQRLRKSISDKIKSLRVEKGLSQRVLANKIDIEQKQYWRLEAGENFTIDTLLTVLGEFEISLKEFFSDIK